MRWCLAAALWLAGALAPAAQEFTTLKGHGGPIMALAVAPDGRVASASFDNSVGLWQGRAPTWLEGHDAAVTALAIGPQGRLVSGGDDFAVRLWGDAPRELGRHLGKVTALAIAPDGGRVASGSWDGTIRLWPLGPGAEPREMPPPGAGVNALAYAPDGRSIYAATTAGEVLRYAADGSAVAVIVRNGFPVNELLVGPGWIAYGAVDGVTRVIETGTGEPIADFTLDRRPILAMAHHPGSGQLAVGDGHGYIMMIDTADWTIARDFRAARNGPVWALAFSPDGTVIHAGGIDDVVFSWPVAMLDRFDPAMGQERSFLRPAETMPNGERQFMRKCSICHSLEPGPSRQAGPTLFGIFGRPAGAVPGYPYSPVLAGSNLVWTEETIDALFDIGPDHYIPGSKMPMQVIAGAGDRADLVAFLKQATKGE